MGEKKRRKKNIRQIKTKEAERKRGKGWGKNVDEKGEEKKIGKKNKKATGYRGVINNLSHACLSGRQGLNGKNSLAQKRKFFAQFGTFFYLLFDFFASVHGGGVVAAAHFQANGRERGV